MGWLNENLTALILPSGGALTPGSGTVVIGANQADGTLPPELVAAGYIEADVFYSNAANYAATHIEYKFDAFKITGTTALSRELGIVAGVSPTGTIHLDETMVDTFDGVNYSYTETLGAIQNTRNTFLMVAPVGGLASVGMITEDPLGTRAAVIEVSGASAISRMYMENGGVAGVDVIGQVTAGGKVGSVRSNGSTSYVTDTDPTIDEFQPAIPLSVVVGGSTLTGNLDIICTHDRDVELLFNLAGAATVGAGNAVLAGIVPVAFRPAAGLSGNKIRYGSWSGNTGTGNANTNAAAGQLAVLAIPAGTTTLTGHIKYTIPKPTF